MSEVCPEGYIGGLCSDMTLNRWGMRSKFGYTILSEIDLMLRIQDLKRQIIIRQ